MTGQHVAQHLCRRVIRAVGTGRPKRDHGESIRQIAGHMKAVGFYGLQLDRGTSWQFLGGNIPEKALHDSQRRLWVHVANDNQDRVVRRVPAGVETLQHRPRRLVERWPRTESIMFVRRALEHRVQQLRVQHVLGIGEVLRHFLFDRPAFLVPQFVGGKDAAHPQRFDVQRRLQIVGGHGEIVLRDRLLRVGVEVAAHRGGNLGQLVRRQARIPPKHHVLQRVRHAGKPRRRLVRPDPVIHDRRHHRRDRVAHDHHPQPVL